MSMKLFSNPLIIMVCFTQVFNHKQVEGVYMRMTQGQEELYPKFHYPKR